MTYIATDLNLLSNQFDDIRVQAIGGLYSDLYGGPGVPRDISQLVERITLTESISEAARRMELVCDNYDPSLLNPVHSGSGLVFYGHPVDSGTGAIMPMARLFQGTVFDDYRDDSEGEFIHTYIAYDLATILARNEDIYVFNEVSATQIFQRICADYGLPTNTVVDTVDSIGQIVMGPNFTLWAALQEAFRRTYRINGNRYFVRVVELGDTPALELRQLGQTGVTWNVYDGPSGIVTNAHVDESAEQLFTKVSIVITEPVATDTTDPAAPGPVAPGMTRRVDIEASAEAAGEIRDTFGFLQKYVLPDAYKKRAGILRQGKKHVPTLGQSSTDAQFELDIWARTILKATIQGLMLPGIRRGDAVNLNEGRAGAGTFYTSQWFVDTVTLTYSEGPPTMSLDLVWDPVDAGGGAQTA